MRATSVLSARARYVPVSEPNKVKTVTKLEDGGLRVEFNSGRVATLSKDDPLIQAFAVYSVLADL